MQLDVVSVMILAFVAAALVFGVWYEHSGVKKEKEEEKENIQEN